MQIIKIKEILFEEALFGCKIKVGSETPFLPAHVLKDLVDEDSHFSI